MITTSALGGVGFDMMCLSGVSAGELIASACDREGGSPTFRAWLALLSWPVVWPNLFASVRYSERLVHAMYRGDLTPDEAYEKLMQSPGAVLIDVRTGPEWAFVGVPAVEGLLRISWQD